MAKAKGSGFSFILSWGAGEDSRALLGPWPGAKQHLPGPHRSEVDTEETGYPWPGDTLCLVLHGEHSQ